MGCNSSYNIYSTKVSFAEQNTGIVNHESLLTKVWFYDPRCPRKHQTRKIIYSHVLSNVFTGSLKMINSIMPYILLNIISQKRCRLLVGSNIEKQIARRSFLPFQLLHNIFILNCNT